MCLVKVQAKEEKQKRTSKNNTCGNYRAARWHGRMVVETSKIRIDPTVEADHGREIAC